MRVNMTQNVDLITEIDSPHFDFSFNAPVDKSFTCTQVK